MLCEIRHSSHASGALGKSHDDIKSKSCFSSGVPPIGSPWIKALDTSASECAVQVSMV